MSWLTSALVWAQTPSWQQVIATQHPPVVGTPGNSSINATATDASGNVYTLGGFSRTMLIGTSTLDSNSGGSCFVAKWSPTGSLLWVVQYGGSIAATSADKILVKGTSIYLAGRLVGATASQFGSTALTNVNPSTGSENMYLAKLVDNGSSASWAWARSLGSSSSSSRLWALSAAGADLYMAGSFYGGSMAFDGTTLTSATPGGFVARLSDAGTTSQFGWAKLLLGPVYALVPTTTGVYLAGGFQNTIALGTTTLTAVGLVDMYIAKLLDAGAAPTVAWAMRAGGASSQFAYALAVEGSNVYVAGNFASATLPWGAAVLTNAGSTPNYNDGFVAKLVDEGTVATFSWAQRLGGADADAVLDLAVRGTSLYCTGFFTGTVSLGSTQLTSVSSPGSPRSDVYIAKLQDAGPTGSVSWALQAGGAGPDVGQSLVIAGNKVYVAGNTTPLATFGSQSVPSSALPNTLNSVAFLASLTDAQLLAASGPRALAGTAVFPNPAHLAATVRLPGAVGSTIAKLILSDGVGRPVRTQQVLLSSIGATAEVPLLGLAPGLYHIEVQAGDQRVTHTLVVD